MHILTKKGDEIKMQSIKLGFDSVTYAMEARDLLARHGIMSDIVRQSRSHSKGCSFALELPINAAAAAESLLSKANMRYTHAK